MTRREKQTGRRLPIGRIVLIAFIVMPIIEIAVLIRVGGWIGLWPTLALIVLTAMLGTWMLRRQGFAVLARAREQLERGAVPLAEVFEGFCLVMAGALLLTPGFVTDAMGGVLLLPPVRAWLYRTLGRHFRAAVVSPSGPRTQPGGDGSGPVVEGDYESIDPDRPPADERRPGSPDETMPPPRGGWGSRR